MSKKHIGSSFDSFLEDESLLVETEALALKKVISWQLEQAIKKIRITKTEMAKRMHTSRIAVDRLLDPTNTSVTLKSLERAAVAVGKKIHLEFADL